MIDGLLDRTQDSITKKEKTMFVLSYRQVHQLKEHGITERFIELARPHLLWMMGC
jgi:hypothetical protein